MEAGGSVISTKPSAAATSSGRLAYLEPEDSPVGTSSSPLHIAAWPPVGILNVWGRTVEKLYIVT